jgi:DNA polymerase III subunit chi
VNDFMTKIDFFSNAPNRLDYVARLLLKVHTSGQTAVVYGPSPTLSALSQALWQSHAFLAHEHVDSEPAEPLVAPIILTSAPLSDYPHHEVFINLSDEQPASFAQFHRLIEVVPNDDIPRQAARERWQHYKSRGYVMSHHDISAKKRG